MSDDDTPGVAMVLALLVGMLVTAGLAVRLLLWMLSAAMVLVQGWKEMGGYPVLEDPPIFLVRGDARLQLDIAPVLR